MPKVRNSTALRPNWEDLSLDTYGDVRLLFYRSFGVMAHMFLWSRGSSDTTSNL